MSQRVRACVSAWLLVAGATACSSTARRTEAPPAPSAGPPPVVVPAPRVQPPSGRGEGLLATRTARASSADGPERLYWQAVSAWHLQHDPRTAERLVEQGLAQESGHPRLLLLHCSLANVDRRYAVFLERCARAAVLAAGQPEAEVALALLDHARGQHPDHPARMMAAALQSLDACPSHAERCGPLALAALPRAAALAGGRVDEALFTGLVARAGTVTRWAVSGPWDGHGPDVYGALGPFGATGAPATPPRPPVAGVFHRTTRQVPDGMLLPARHNAPGIYVAESAIHLARPARVIVEARGTGAFRVFVGGSLMVERDAWSPPRSAVRRAEAMMAPGWHHLVVAADVDGSDPVLVRVMGAAGSTPMDVTAPALPEGAAWSPPPTPVPPERGTALQLRDAFRADPSDVEAGMAAVLLLGAEGDLAGARELASEVVDLYPRSARALQALSTSTEDDAAVPATRRDARVRALLGRAADVEPDMLIPAYRLAVLDQQHRQDEARTRLEALARQRPDYPHAWRSLFELYRALDWPADARRALEAGLSTGAIDGLVLPGAAWFSSRGAYARAAALREQVLPLEDSPWSPARADQLAERMDIAGAATEWRRILKAYPDHPRRDEFVAFQRAHAPATEWRDAALEHLARFPGDADVALQLCQARRATGDVRGARACIADVLAIQPGESAAHRMAAELDGVAPGSAEWPDTRALIAETESALAAHAPWLSDHMAVTVLDAAWEVVEADGAARTLFHRVIRVGTREDADALGEISLGNNEERRVVRVYKAGGAVVEPEPAQGKSELSLSGLEPGDYIETRTWSAGDAPRNNAFRETFYFDGEHPVLRAVYELDLPAAHMDRVRMDTRGVPAPSVVNRAGRVVHRWTREHVPPIVPEPFGAPGVEHRARVLVTLGVTPDLDARLSCRHLADADTGSPELNAWARELERGSPTARVRLDMALQQVRARVLPAEDETSAAEAEALGRGSHLSVLRALLRRLGIPARVVLARSRLAAVNPVPIPGDHDATLLHVALPDGARWFLAMDGHLVDDPLPPILVDGTGIDGECEQSGVHGARVDIPAGVAGAWEHSVDIDLALAATGDARGVVRATLRGPVALRIRRDVAQATPQQVEQWLAAQVVQHLPGAVLTDVTTSDLGARAGAFTLGAAFTVQGLARPGTDRSLAWEGFLERPVLRGAAGAPAIDEYLRVAERTSPLHLSRPFAERDTLRITLPPGARLVAAPRPFAASGEGYELAQKVRQSGDVVELVRSQQVSAVRVAPDAYAAWRRGVEAATAQGRNRLAWALPGRGP